MDTPDSMLEHTAPSTLDSAMSTAALPVSVLSDKHERFVLEYIANGGNLSDAYRSVYPHSGDQEAVWTSATRLRSRADVQARLAEFAETAAERTLAKPEHLLRELQAIVDADPTELSRVVARACDQCWAPEVFNTASIDALAAIRRGEPATLPDTSQPRSGCPAHPRAHRAVIVTPTDQLSGPVRRLIRSIKAKGDDIEVQVIDQFAARQELHTLRRMRITQSINANVALDPSKPNPWSDAEQSPADVLARVMKARRSQAASVVTVAAARAEHSAPAPETPAC